MNLTEPEPPDPSWPRYCDLPFPPYRFVPGLNPHPVRDPRGHSFAGRTPRVRSWSPDEWGTLTPYLYGVDLYNYAYWWESHEVLEGLWHAAGRTGTAAALLHAIIHVAAANLARHRGRTGGARRQAAKAVAHLESIRTAERRYMGVDVDTLARDVDRSFFSEAPGTPPLIDLHE